MKKENSREKMHSIEKLSMSVRLKHILRRKGISYLEQIQEYPKESIQKFRNMGEETLQELYLICEQNNIHIYDKSDLEDAEKGITFQPSKYEKLFYKGIRCKQDLLNISKNVMENEYDISSNEIKKLMKLKTLLEQSM